MKVSVFVPIKASHSTGCCLGWLVVGIRHHPTACTGKGQNQPPGAVFWLRNWAGHLASTSPFLLCGCHPQRRRRCERRVPGWLGAICTTSVSLTSPKTNRSSRLHPSNAGSLFWLPFLWWDNIRDKNNIWPELGFLHLLLLFTRLTAMLEGK